MLRPVCSPDPSKISSTSQRALKGSCDSTCYASMRLLMWNVVGPQLATGGQSVGPGSSSLALVVVEYLQLRPRSLHPSKWSVLPVCCTLSWQDMPGVDVRADGLVSRMSHFIPSDSVHSSGTLNPFEDVHRSIGTSNGSRDASWRLHVSCYRTLCSLLERLGSKKDSGGPVREG